MKGILPEEIDLVESMSDHLTRTSNQNTDLLSPSDPLRFANTFERFERIIHFP